ncbi:hypothetical protein AMTR_s00108p00104580 [Amborella trichopoda]|uniref:Uncharacterized protein n=1 Tax=Amborella trichopoda TaxID=13333 RepID=W1NVI0_AMBTC|nr:hypothetical protein AMTR_s00108p00104580 [Amborella trichopoda]
MCLLIHTLGPSLLYQWSPLFRYPTTPLTLWHLRFQADMLLLPLKLHWAGYLSVPKRDSHQPHLFSYPPMPQTDHPTPPWLEVSSPSLSRASVDSIFVNEFDKARGNVDLLYRVMGFNYKGLIEAFEAFLKSSFLVQATKDSKGKATATPQRGNCELANLQCFINYEKRGVLNPPCCFLQPLGLAKP